MAKFSKKEIVTISQEDQEEIAYARNAFYKEHGRECALDDATVLVLMNSQESMEDCLAAMLDADPSKEDEKSSVSVSANERDKDAVSFGTKLNATGAMSHIQELVETREKLKRLPAVIAFGIKSEMTKADLDALPNPGSTLEDVKGTNRASIFDLRGPGKGSFYGDAYDTTTAGISNAKVIATVKAAKDRTADSDQELRAKGDKWLGAELDRLTARRSAGIRGLKDAIKLLRRIEEVESKLTLKVEFRTMTVNGKEEIEERVTAPMRILDPVKLRDMYMSVGAFLSVKVDAVARTEDHFANFVVERKPRSGKAATLPIKLKNAGQFVEAAYEMVGFFDDAKSIGDLYSILNSDEGGEFASSLFKLETEVHKITRKPEVQAKYKAYQEAQLATTKAA